MLLLNNCNRFLSSHLLLLLTIYFFADEKQTLFMITLKGE